MCRKKNFLVFGFESGGIEVKKEFTLSQLYDEKKESKLHLSLSEILDNIIDLKVNETLFISVNRDDKNAKGILIRLK